MRHTTLLLALMIAGCAQPVKRKADEIPIVVENPPLFERIRTHQQARVSKNVAENGSAETSVEGAVTR